MYYIVGDTEMLTDFKWLQSVNNSINAWLPLSPSMHVIVIMYGLDMRQMSVISRAIQEWNSLPHNLIDLNDLTQFL